MYTSEVREQLDESTHDGGSSHIDESTPGYSWAVASVLVLVVLAVLWRLCDFFCNRFMRFPLKLSVTNRRYPVSRIFPDLTMDREHVLQARSHRYSHIISTAATPAPRTDTARP
ncbi:uncharacterized protein LOC115447400 [Manduca sexta]|uniref:uncharacterized protein LOC115447400 n=1 Tax=Manduca sexta TaxID=7130 RepID=UPI0011822DC3|nr:uncharacterized protein LOC115447400 [Manduca sexta]